jgi:thymidylate synthase
MFKTVLFVDIDDAVLDVSQSGFAVRTTIDEIMVITEDMLGRVNISKFRPSLLVVIGVATDIKTEAPVKEFPKIETAIRYLSNSFGSEPWWIICDTQLMNKFIWHGAIMDVHIIKNRKPINCTYDKLSYELLNHEACQFSIKKYHYTIDEDRIEYTHYSRKNEEEMRLLEVMGEIVRDGHLRNNRTGVSTYSTFGKTFEYRMVERDGMYRFPLLTTKRMFVRGVFAELKWFLSGHTDSKILEGQGVNLWKGNSTREYLDEYGLSGYQEGKCGPIYGHQWRAWGAPYDQTKTSHIGEGIDQVQQCLTSLKNDPFGRRHIISGWNVGQLAEMALPPCHVIYQFYVHEEGGQRYLSLSMYQRSGDTFLGIPFNICSMGLFLLLMSHQLGYKPYKLVHTVGDMHVYANHIEAITKQIVRTPNMFPFVGMKDIVRDNIEDYEFNDIIVDGYISHAAIKADMVA